MQLIENHIDELFDVGSVSINESVEEKARHLVKIQVFFDGKDAFSFNYEGKVHVFHGDKAQLTKFLQSFKAKDNKTQPRSVRGERYADIAQEIIDQTDNVIYAWSNDLANATLKKESESQPTVQEVSFDSIFIFYDSEVQELFNYWLKKNNIKYQSLINKVYVAGDVSVSKEILDLLDKHSGEFENYSIKEYNDLFKRGLIEAIRFSRDGAEIDNSDGRLFDDLFAMIEGDPRWKTDRDHRRCVRNDGSYLMIKGNLLTMGKNGSAYITLPWTKYIMFTVMADGSLAVRFEVHPNAGVGRFVL